MSVPAYIRLSDLAGHIEETIDAVFSYEHFWVLAEISNLKHYPSKQHYYFDLVEKSPGEGTTLACLSACAWKTGARAVQGFEAVTGQAFTNGIQVLIQVAVTFHPVYGMKLVLHDLNPEYTIGNLHRQRQETLDRLLRDCPEEVALRDGVYLTKNKRTSLKPVIQSVAVISSDTAAGYEDFRRTLKANADGFTFCVHSYYTPVQGRDADKHMVDCLIDIYRSGFPYDAVILVRGGGSQTDLLTYDSYRLARAVAKFPIPVITGIGHLRDVSIVDLMAHTHEITPTRAAEFIIHHNRRFERELKDLRQELLYSVQQRLAGVRNDLETAHTAIAYGARDFLGRRREALTDAFHTVTHETSVTLLRHDRDLVQLTGRLASRPLALVDKKAGELSGLSNLLKVASQHFTGSRKRELDGLGLLFRMLSPERTLQRGFAIISRQGKVLKEATGIAAGDELLIRMSNAVLSATVTEKTQPDEPTDDL